MENTGPGYFELKRPYKVIVCLVTIWSFLFTSVFQGISIGDLAWAREGGIGLPGVSPDARSAPGRKVTNGLKVDGFSLPGYFSHSRDERIERLFAFSFGGFNHYGFLDH